jgi:alpha-tubulin suppressor-like RCC1 family protein
MSFLHCLPSDSIFEIGLRLSYSDIISFSQLNNRFTELVRNNNYFWRQKFYFDFGPPEEDVNITSWKYAYNSYGKIYFFGRNGSGQLGLGNNAYNYYGKIYSFGNNKYGQLGLGNNGDRNIPTQIPNIRAKSVTCGTRHKMIIDLDDNIWSFGSNYYGQLGLGDDQNRNIPTQIPNLKAKDVSCGTYHTVIIDFNDNVWSFGDNEYGQLGLGDNQDRNIPTQISNLKVKDVSCGIYHTVIIDLNNDIWFLDIIVLDN